MRSRFLSCKVTPDISVFCRKTAGRWWNNRDWKSTLSWWVVPGEINFILLALLFWISIVLHLRLIPFEPTKSWKPVMSMKIIKHSDPFVIIRYNYYINNIYYGGGWARNLFKLFVSQYGICELDCKKIKDNRPLGFKSEKSIQTWRKLIIIEGCMSLLKLHLLGRGSLIDRHLNFIHSQGAGKSIPTRKY